MEQHRHGETIKELKKNDRRLKELVFQVEEERKAQMRLHDLNEQLQSKIKIYKRQIEEAGATKLDAFCSFVSFSLSLFRGHRRDEFGEISKSAKRIG